MRLGKKKEKDRGGSFGGGIGGFPGSGGGGGAGGGGGGDGQDGHEVDGITRLICLAKAQNPLRGEIHFSEMFVGDHGCVNVDFTLPCFSVYIDGLEWQGVKFFQLSSQWQTHIKVLPVATMAAQQQHTAL